MVTEAKKMPDAFKNLAAAVKTKAKSILDSLLADGMEEGKAIRIAITRAKQVKTAEEFEAAKKPKFDFKQFIKDKNDKKKKGKNGKDDGDGEPKKGKFQLFKKKKKGDKAEEDYIYGPRFEKSDDKVNYRATEGGDDVDQCSGCRFYSYTSCNLVEGHIEPSYTCDLWDEKLPSQRRFGETEEEAEELTRRSSSADDPQREANINSNLESQVAILTESGKPNFKNRVLFEHSSIGEQLSGSVWEVICIAPGLSLNRTYYSDKTLQEAAPLFEGVKAFADHKEGPRSVSEVVGWYSNARYEAGRGIVAEFNALESQDWFLGPLRESYDRGKTDLIGFSINGSGIRAIEKRDGQNVWNVSSITSIESVDGVINPSAGGQIVKLVASSEEEGSVETKTLDELKVSDPELYEELMKTAREQEAEAIKDGLDEMKAKENADADAEAKAKKKKEEDAKAKEAEEAEAKAKLEEQSKTDPLAEQKVALEEATKKAIDASEKLEEQAAVSSSRAMLREHIGGLSLPQVIKDKMEAQFEGKIFSKEDLETAVKENEDLLRGLSDERPDSYGHITTGEDQTDRAKKALEGLFAEEDIDGVPRARTIKEAYAAFKGMPTWAHVDAGQVLRESYGAEVLEQGNDRTLKESLTSSSWSSAMAETIHRRLLVLYNTPYLTEWRKVVSTVSPAPDFKTQRRTRTGGYGKFSSVSEGATYSPVTSPSDEESTYTVTKFGGTEDLTMEAIANDDVGAVIRIPRQLADAQKRTIYESVLNLIFTNAVISYDTTALFETNTHINVVASGTNDTALGDGSMAIAKRLLVQQTELDSGKKLGLRAALLLIPPELEPIAIRLKDNEFAASAIGTEGEGAASPAADRMRDVNVHRNSFEYLVVPYWDDTDYWVLMSSPAQLPTIEVSFYLGREEPELFVQDMPNVGSMFDADKLTYKSRVIFGHAVVDHRGFIASSEATHTAP